MPYAVTILDRAECEHLRPQHQAAHYRYLKQNEHLILLRGGFQDPQGAFIGGLLVLDLPTVQAVQDFIGDDPYALAGMHGEVSIRRFAPAYCADVARWR